MPKTVTLRINDDLYSIFKTAAEGEHRPLSKFIENAALNYLSSDSYVSDREMTEILDDKVLVKRLKAGEEDYKAGRYRIVK